ncbi:MAG: Uma2 family endonuclease [Chloroflexota bacterium]
MTLQERFFTAEQFDAFTERPENADKLFEFIGGEIVEVPSNPYSSKIAARFTRYLGEHADDNDLGHVTGEQGGYQVSGERYAPDTAYISFERQEALVKSGYNPNAPDIAVEVVSSDSTAENDMLTIKLGNYLTAGTVVWIVRPEKKRVEVHVPGQPVKVLNETDTLTGGDVLPKLKIDLRKIFKA